MAQIVSAAHSLPNDEGALWLEELRKRVDRLELEGVPVTVWQTRCWDANSHKRVHREATLFSPTKFDALRLCQPLDKRDHLQNMPGFLADECRSCTGRFVFKANGSSALILTGMPSNMRYKAISYVWGATKPLLILCNGCLTKKFVEMSSAGRFSLLLSLASTASGCQGVWLDSLSIDQDSHYDRQMLLGRMGDIYRAADSALVLLTQQDRILFDYFDTLIESSVLQNDMNLDVVHGKAVQKLNQSQKDNINQFIRNIDRLKNKLHVGNYFQRAWTLQEWTLARDLDIACEETQSASNPFKLLPNVKSSVIRAAVRLVVFKRTSGNGDGIDISDPETVAFMHDIKSLFPDEDIFCTSEEVDWHEAMLDNKFPHTGLNHELGLRLAGDERSPTAKFRARLHFSLNALSLSGRRAKFESDKIACWASMCNLQYDYQRDDGLFVTQKKVLDAIRRQGLKVFNFQANIKGASAEMDQDFLLYSSAHLLRNSTHRAFTFAAPSFSGVADFACHLKSSLTIRPAVELCGSGVALKAVIGPKLSKNIPAENVDAVVQALAQIQTGYWEEFAFHSFRDIGSIARETLKSVPQSHLSQFCLVVVSFEDANLLVEPEEDPREKQRQRQQAADNMNFLLSKDLLERPFEPYTAENVPVTTLSPTCENLKHAWAFCRKSDFKRTFFVARESLNGTLVLARIDPAAEHAYVAAYLTGVDMMSGAYLLPTDDDGLLDICLRAPQRSDIFGGAAGGQYWTRDRRCVAELQIEEVPGGLIAF